MLKILKKLKPMFKPIAKRFKQVFSKQSGNSTKINSIMDKNAKDIQQIGKPLDAAPNSIIEAAKNANANPYGKQVGQVHQDGSTLYKKTLLGKQKNALGVEGTYIGQTTRTIVDASGRVKRVITKEFNPMTNSLSVESRTARPRNKTLVETNLYDFRMPRGKENTYSKKMTTATYK